MYHDSHRPDGFCSSRAGQPHLRARLPEQRWIRYAGEVGRTTSSHAVPSACAPNRCPAAHALEVFQGASTSGVLCLLRKTPANRAVGICLETSRPARTSAERASGRCRAVAVQIATATGRTAAVVLNALARARCAVTICCDSGNAQVNAREIVHSRRFRRRNHTGDEQAQLAADGAQVGFTPIGFTPIAFTKPAMAPAALIAHALSATQCPDVHRIGREAEDTVVIGNRAAPAEAPIPFPVKLAGINDLADHARGHLRRQAKPLADGVAGPPVDGDADTDLLPPRRVIDAVSRLIGRLHRWQQKLPLFARRERRDVRGGFHGSGTTQTASTCAMVKGSRAHASPG